MALIGKMRFTIYDVYDNNTGGCDYGMTWDKDYRFDERLRFMGQLLCLDFEQTCTTFITGS